MAQYMERENVCAIFVHGGAGTHNEDTEDRHLELLAKAANIAMSFMKSGGSAVDAVEVAIIILEDDPLMNAGRGSNLNVNGKVECDASIVDHFGRSGAVGAVPAVKNPISLARKIYDESYLDPGANRIPPNFLCGEGAMDYAWSRGVVVVPNDEMVTEHTRARWQQWCHQVEEYERINPPPHTLNVDPWIRRPLTPLETRLQRLRETGATVVTLESEKNDEIPRVNIDSVGDADGQTKAKDSSQPDMSSNATLNTSFGNANNVTDTVGAIAIDKKGNIAAGSSSGGIGMKHRGRIGPAGLVGIGTHVMPMNRDDPERTTVAVVTSGTGEHLANTFAASTIAQRIFHCQKKSRDGSFYEVDEQEALSSAIKREFLDHPAILNNAFRGCIGALAVKKTNHGLELYHAHTTESFALAVMTADDDDPRGCVSRNLNPGYSLAHGGMFIAAKPVANGFTNDILRNGHHEPNPGSDSQPQPASDSGSDYETVAEPDGA